MAFMKVLGGGVVNRPGQWGASCNFFSFDGISIVIDCGVRLNTDESPLPDLEWLKDKRVDAVLITHAHTDHVGAAPLLTTQHPEAEVFMTFDTSIISQILLEGNLDVAENCDRPIAYGREDWGKLFDRTIIVEFGEWQIIERCGRKLQFCFWSAGHIRGAASILIKDENGNHYLITGDLSLHSTPTVEAPKPIPTDFVNDNLVVVTEATNGGRQLPSRLEEKQRLIERIHQVMARGGKVIIPTFAVGRTPDTALELAEAGIVVHIGGKMANELLISDAFGHKFFHENFRKLNGDLEYSSNSRNTNVVVATHGMLEGSVSRELAYRWMEDPKNAIFFVGYQAHGTMGCHVQSTKPGDCVHFVEKELKGKPHLRRLNAEMETFQLSAHTDGVDLAKWIASLSPKMTYIVHAEEDGAKGLRDRLWSCEYRKPIVPALNDGVLAL